MYLQVGDFCVAGPLTRISCNTVFSKSQNARKAGTLWLMMMFSVKATKFEKKFLIHKFVKFYRMVICLNVSLMQIWIRDVSTRATGMTAVAPNYSVTLNLFQQVLADSANHWRSCTKIFPVVTSLQNCWKSFLLKYVGNTFATSERIWPHLVAKFQQSQLSNPWIAHALSHDFWLRLFNYQGTSLFVF